MALISSLFNPQAERWRDQHTVAKASTESEENLLPKDEGDTEAPIPLRPVSNTTQVVITVTILLLWGAAAFIAGSMTSNTQRDSPFGSAENGFVEERIISKSNEIHVSCFRLKIFANLT